MTFFSNPSRRHFLQTTAAALASFILPKSLFAKTPDRSFWFLHADTLSSWPVADPVAWCLQHANEPILEGASEGLRKLTVDDGDRIIRLVRRCRLNLLELHPRQVVVHHWGSHRADVRPFFKQHGLACPEIEVVLRDRKKELITVKTGDNFLYGDRLAADFPLDNYLSKWTGRFSKEADDWKAAPGMWSGFAWEGVEDNRIPWMALKSAWRRASLGQCQNCDTPTILVNFGQPWTGMFSRTPTFIHACSQCRRSFKDESVNDVAGWMSANLDAEVRPGFDIVWDRRVARGREGRA